MNKPFYPGASHRTWRRRAAGIAGVTVAFGVLVSVTLLFGEASRMPWLPETPANVAAMQRCDNVQGSAARRECAQQVVAAVLTRDAALQVAEAETAESPANPRR